jgi:hypothetical protein
MRETRLRRSERGDQARQPRSGIDVRVAARTAADMTRCREVVSFQDTLAAPGTDLPAGCDAIVW